MNLKQALPDDHPIVMRMRLKSFDQESYTKESICHVLHEETARLRYEEQDPERKAGIESVHRIAENLGITLEHLHRSLLNCPICEFTGRSNRAHGDS